MKVSSLRVEPGCMIRTENLVAMDEGELLAYAMSSRRRLGYVNFSCPFALVVSVEHDQAHNITKLCVLVDDSLKRLIMTYGNYVDIVSD